LIYCFSSLCLVLDSLHLLKMLTYWFHLNLSFHMIWIAFFCFKLFITIVYILTDRFAFILDNYSYFLMMLPLNLLEFQFLDFLTCYLIYRCFFEYLVLWCCFSLFVVEKLIILYFFINFFDLKCFHIVILIIFRFKSYFSAIFL